MSNELKLLVIIVAIIIATIVTLLAYYKKQGELPSMQYYILTILRFIGVLLLCLLLVNPIMRKSHFTEQPTKVLVAFDNSESILYAEKQVGAELQHVVADIKAGINSKLDVDLLSFGQVVHKNNEFSGTDIKSDYNLIIRSVRDNYIGQNVNALVLVGDGIHNSGSNPIFQNYNATFPIYTIGFGDTTGVIDTYVGAIKHNRTTFIGNSFPVQVNVGATLCRARKLKVSVTDKSGQAVFADNITPTSDKYQNKLNFTLSSTEKGKNAYVVKIEDVVGEKNLLNNEVAFSIEAVDEKRKILALSAGPSPDLGMIKRALESQNNYDVDFMLFNDKIPNVKDYDLVVVHSLPQEKNDYTSGALEEASNAKVSQLYFVSGNTDIVAMQSLGFKFDPLIKNTDRLEANVSTSFSLFNLDENIKTFINSASPVVGSLSSLDTSDKAWSVLSTRKVRGLETDSPLIAFRFSGGSKQGLFLAEGFWRWRMNAYRVFGTHDNFDSFVQKIINFLIVDKNEDNLNVYNQKIYEQGDKIKLIGELYNDNYEMVADEDVSMLLTDSAKNVFNYMFDKVGDRYELDLGSLPIGEYNFDAKVDLGGREIHKRGSFEVLRMNVEAMQTVADFNMLRQLAEKNGGQFAISTNYTEIIDQINKSASKAELIEHSSFTSVINQIWICVLLILLMFTEWLLRKYWGLY